MNGSTDLEGVPDSITALDLEWARLLDRPDFRRMTAEWARLLA